MRFIELSIKDLEEESNKLAENISKDYNPDVVVFIAKGSFIIGYEISRYFNVPLVECFAEREGNKVKDLLSPILKIIPKDLKKILRKKELKSGMHLKNSSRNVYINNGFDILKKSESILVVDDSVDTGNTAKEVSFYLTSELKEVTIKFAALNYFEDSKKIFLIDFSLHKDHIMEGPWSKDSRFYADFVKKYNVAKHNGVF